MRILQINSLCGTGSTGKIAVDLYNVLKDNGHECKIAYGRGEARGISLEDTIKIGSKADVYIHAALARLWDKSGFYSKSATKRFLKVVDEYKPDIIHLHNIHGYYINIELLFNYIKEKKIPVVWTLHDCWSFTGHCAHFDYAGCEKWKSGCHDCVCKNQYPKSLTDNSKRNYAKKKELFSGIENMTIVSVSHWLDDLVTNSFLKAYNHAVIYNGIDVDKFKHMDSDFRNKYNLNNKTVILGVASVWSDRKGLDDFIKLAGMIDDKYRIVLVGLNKKQMRLMPENIIGLARTDTIEELAGLYSMADVFFNPSVEETFGLTVAEAILCGTPAIVYNATALPECVDKDNGFVVEKHDLQTVADLIDKVKEIKVSDVLTKYDKSERFKEYLGVYGEYV